MRPTGVNSVAFTGTETYTRGTGRFAGASDSASYAGTAVTAPPGSPGSGTFTRDGSITY